MHCATFVLVACAIVSVLSLALAASTTSAIVTALATLHHLQTGYVLMSSHILESVLIIPCRSLHVAAVQDHTNDANVAHPTHDVDIDDDLPDHIMEDFSRPGRPGRLHHKAPIVGVKTALHNPQPTAALRPASPAKTPPDSIEAIGKAGPVHDAPDDGSMPMGPPVALRPDTSGDDSSAGDYSPPDAYTPYDEPPPPAVEHQVPAAHAVPDPVIPEIHMKRDQENPMGSQKAATGFQDADLPEVLSRPEDEHKPAPLATSLLVESADSDGRRSDAKPRLVSIKGRRFVLVDGNNS
jgi:hypothetical protein